MSTRERMLVIFCEQQCGVLSLTVPFINHDVCLLVTEVFVFNDCKR